MTHQPTDPDALGEQVRARYAAAATKLTTGVGGCGCGQPADCGCGGGCCGAATAQEPGFGAERGAWVGCIAGALSRGEYEAGLAAAGFTDVSVAFTHQVGDGLHSAIIKATKPAASRPPASAARLPVVQSTACC